MIDKHSSSKINGVLKEFTGRQAHKNRTRRVQFYFYYVRGIYQETPVLVTPTGIE